MVGVWWGCGGSVVGEWWGSGGGGVGVSGGTRESMGVYGNLWESVGGWLRLVGSSWVKLID